MSGKMVVLFLCSYATSGVLTEAVSVFVESTVVVSDIISIAVSSESDGVATVVSAGCSTGSSAGCSAGATVSTTVVSVGLAVPRLALVLYANTLLTDTITIAAIAAKTNFFICVVFLSCEYCLYL